MRKGKGRSLGFGCSLVTGKNSDEVVAPALISKEEEANGELVLQNDAGEGV